ncbi:MAG: hypothetical protein IIV85_04600, partial [Clostridia bacterium]|nr:hypothetical protein [Clostridia bacterium]
MIHLFPKRKNRMYLICGCYIALVGAYFALNKGVNPIPVLLIAAVGLAIVIFSQCLTAFNMHSQLLSKLYDHLNVDGFLKAYEPMLKMPVKNPNIALTLRLHASNAYCAQGRFDEAIALLTNF